LDVQERYIYSLRYIIRRQLREILDLDTSTEEFEAA